MCLARPAAGDGYAEEAREALAAGLARLTEAERALPEPEPAPRPAQLTE